MLPAGYGDMVNNHVFKFTVREESLGFLGLRFVAFLSFNLGMGVPSSEVTGMMETMSRPPPAQVEGRGATDDVVSACLLAGAAQAAWLSTSSQP